MSFEELVKKISPKLKGIAYKLERPHFSNFDDDDLFQEALLCLWQDYNSGKLDGKTDSYILQGCYFHLKNYIRKTRDNARLMSIHKPADQESDMESREIFFLTAPGSLFIDVSNKTLIEDILNDGLTKREKSVFSFLLRGYTVREIAKELGVSHVSIVKSGKRIKEKCQKFKDPV